MDICLVRTRAFSLILLWSVHVERRPCRHVKDGCGFVRILARPLEVPTEQAHSHIATNWRSMSCPHTSPYTEH
jgi:hypothetical protein